MNPEDGVRTLLDRIEATGSEYLLVGAFAVRVWGTPRLANDADFVVTLPCAKVDAMLGGLPSEFAVETQTETESLTGGLRWSIELASSLFTAKIFLCGEDPHHLEMFTRKRRQHIPKIERDAWVPSAEDLVIQKLRWARRKDLDDAQGILAVQGKAIDLPYVQSWCARHGTLIRLAEVKAGVPRPH